ncbi:ferritin-like domain-containing protein, partial [Streptomyces sp. NPDC000188]
LVLLGWRALLLAAALVVACDHGSALRGLGVGRVRFVRDVVASAGPVVRSVLDRAV